MYNLALITKKIYSSDLKLFTLKSLRDILEIKKESTFFEVIRKLLKNEVLVKIERNKYFLKDAKIHDFALANFIYQPSYISFESALSFYGILSQFPYEVLSSTPKKTIQKVINKRVFVYIHIKKDLFWGYEKQAGFLIALPEKALLDQLYLASKGLKVLNFDEYDLSLIKTKRFKEYLLKFPKTRQFNKTLDLIKKYIHL